MRLRGLYIDWQIPACTMLVYTAFMFTSVTLIGPVLASDRDTPAYMIYVDPITGKYSTKPPEDSAATTDTSVISTTNSSGAGSTQTQSVAGRIPDRKISAPLIAILLLTGTAFISLLLKGKQSF